MPFTRRARARAAIALAAYVVFIGFVVFWPTPVDRPFDKPLFHFLGTLAQHGIRPMDAYNALEMGTNVLFFVPAGLLFAMVVGSRRWWLAPVVGFVTSAIIEAGQTVFLVERTGTISDVIMNTLGALLGGLLGVLIARRIERRAAEKAERAAVAAMDERRAFEPAAVP